VTVYLMGDSTVTDQPGEPWAAWGQMLPRFFTNRVAVANYAESGETLRSSAGAGRLDKVVSVLRPGDYVFLQFGHNDQKEKGEGVGAFTTYKTELKRYVSEIRRKGAIPVLVTSMNRRRFDESGKIVATLGDYPEAVRQAANGSESRPDRPERHEQVTVRGYGSGRQPESVCPLSGGKFPRTERAIEGRHPL
jgi:lysophospholipase L1-like esterase